MFTRIREGIGATMERDPATRGRWEVPIYHPDLHAIIVHRAAHTCWHGGFRWLGWQFSHLGRFLTGIEIHPGATAGQRVLIDHGMGAVIGETAEAGDDCAIYRDVTLDGVSLYKSAKRHPMLGKGVVVGAGAKVLGGFVIRDGVRVGSNTVVFKPVSPGATAVGIPAYIIERGAAAKARPALKQESLAYSITPGTDDPVSLVLKRLTDHSEPQRERIESILSALGHLGVHLESPPSDPFDISELKRTFR